MRAHMFVFHLMTLNILLDRTALAVANVETINRRKTIGI